MNFQQNLQTFEHKLGQRLFAFIKKATYTPEEYAKALVDAERFGRPGADVYELFAATATPPDERAHALSRAAGQ